MKINVEKKLRKIVNGNTEGFSMIELVMVLVIAGVSMAIALPKITSVSNIDVYTAARQAKSDIRYTQELAMCKSRDTTITFDSNALTDANTYAITVDPMYSATTLDKQLPPRSKSRFGSVGGFNTVVFTFNSAGEPTPGSFGAGNALIISSGGVSQQIIVSSVTGTATIP